MSFQVGLVIGKKKSVQHGFCVTKDIEMVLQLILCTQDSDDY